MTNTHQTLTVDLGDRSYPIYIGSGLLQQSQLLAPHISGKQILVVTNTTVAALYLDTLMAGLEGLQIEGLQLDRLVLEDGEAHKHLDTVSLVFDHLLQQRHNRTTTLIALGGGVIGDMTGFAAAAYQRGVNFIQVPTTLLSQVDSSVGGKTGVNHPLGKNMIGAFHQPQCVLIDTQSLATLPARELSAGLAEVIKYGLIADAPFFQWLTLNIDQLRLLEPALISQAIYRSCACKAEIVADDEREQGRRALLNFGHTFGHAIENTFGYGTYLHGEAVSIGMCMATRLSMLEGDLSKEDTNRIQSILSKANLPTTIKKGVDSETLIEAMSLDKKSIDGNIRLVLLKSIGDSFITGSYSQENFNKVVSNFCH